MTIRELKLQTAKDFAEELWGMYVKATEPEKKRIYGLRFVFWADVRDRLDKESESIEG